VKKTTYEPHQQLKSIRNALGKTQKQLAEMLNVSYPYLLSVETGQRDMSEALARKISWLVGVPSASLFKKKAQPMSWDENAKKLVPFSKNTFRQHRANFPTFVAPDSDEKVTPSLEGYSKAFHIILDSAMANHRLRLVLQSFFEFFAENCLSDTAIEAFHASRRKLYPDDKEAGAAANALLKRVQDLRSRKNVADAQFRSSTRAGR